MSESSAPCGARPRVLLCDADGSLFPSEEPAFEASVEVTNRLMAELGSARRFTAGELRLATNGRNFRSTVAALAEDAGTALAPEALELWVEEERRAVTAYLSASLKRDPAVIAAVRRLSHRYELAVVSSSAFARVTTCLRVTGLEELIPASKVFSAEDSIAPPRSKPAPDVYLHAGRALGVSGAEAVAVEDAVPGVQAAAAAGFPVVGLTAFVPVDELADRTQALREAGAFAVVESWAELEATLRGFVRERVPAR